MAEGAGAWVSGADGSSTKVRGTLSVCQHVKRDNHTHCMTAAAVAAGRPWRVQRGISSAGAFYMIRQQRGAGGYV